jgi:hypothetical protein
MYEILSGIDDKQLGRQYEKNISAVDTVAILNERFQAYFKDDPVRALLSDGILADAAAGSDYIKIKTDAFFSLKDIQVLEVHEGWVHVGTTLNGLKQHLCTHLAKGPLAQQQPRKDLLCCLSCSLSLVIRRGPGPSTIAFWP